MRRRRTELRRIAAALLAACLFAPPAARAEFGLTGRVSVLGSAAWPRPGDVGAGIPGIGTPSADQQSLRLMLDGHGDDSEWSLHVKASRQRLRGFPAFAPASSDLFRARSLADDHLDSSGVFRSTRLGWEVDRASYRRRFDKLSLTLGRQAIDWGSGRLWQPLNVFGAFAPTDLDTDHKPGIDAGVLNWYPSAFSSLSAVYALAPRDDASIANSSAIHYRRQVGESSQLAIVAGRIIGNPVFGASFESDWRGIGWRIEGLRTTVEPGGEHALFWVAGVDYQFANGTAIAAEWYDNGRGATTETGLPAAISDRLFVYRLQEHGSRRVLGVSVRKDLTPLVRASYTLLAGALKNDDDHRSLSLMHQIAFVYSLSNESDLLLALAYGSGKGLDAGGRPRSEFGSIPAALTLRWRYYF